ncbi:hypothetical protein CR513_61358, partial [Mucuna pruriens]
MVISVVVVEYKVERVLVEQGSSTNVLYWATFQKSGLPKHIDQFCWRTSGNLRNGGFKNNIWYKIKR